MDDQQYQFVDVTGECFKSYQNMGENECDRRYHDFVGASLRASHHGEHTFCVGDMMVFKDELVEAGFKWGKDFFVKKVG